MGALTAFATRTRWYRITGFDRTAYYETQDPEQLAGEDSDLPKEEMLGGFVLPAPPEPTGLLERTLWPGFTLSEKGLLRAIGWTRENLLASWLKSTAIFLVLCGLTHLSWPEPIEKFRAIVPFLFLGFITTLHGICHSSVSACLGGELIGPQSAAAKFHLFPVTLGRAEKLMLKDSIGRWVLFPLSFALASPFHASVPSSFLNSLVLFGLAAFCQVHFTFFYFANNSINEWSPSDLRASIWSLFIKIWLFLGIIASLLTAGMIFPAIFEALNGSSHSLNKEDLLLIIVVFLIFHLVLRGMIRTWIAQPRADLVRQL
jgi:hypothetical protein